MTRAQDELLLDQLTDFGMEATVEVTKHGGDGPNAAYADQEPPQPGSDPDCQHRTNVMGQALVAFIEGDPERWEVRLRCMCECGQSFDLDPATARLPRDGNPGVVLGMHPSVEPAT